MTTQDHYQVLGVPHDATLDQIKKAYRKLARQHHPDVSKAPEAEATFKAAALAYATLKHHEKRAAYDELLRQPEPQAFRPPPSWGRSGSAGGHPLEDTDLEALLAAMRHGGRGTFYTPMPVPGRNLDTTVHVSLHDADHGTSMTLNLTDREGQRTLEVTVPAGVCAGQKLRLRGKGGYGEHGGPDGDIYLHIQLLPHPVFQADRHDLHFALALSPWEAALGAEIEVPTLGASVMLTVPPGTQSGRKLRLRGRGLTLGRGATAGRGDLYATVHIAVPTPLAAPEKALFEELARVSHFNPRAPVAQEAPHETATR
jgi:curved DNA-binding protein